MDFKDSLAVSYQYLGRTHAALGGWTGHWRPIRNTIGSNRTPQSLPGSVGFKNGLAISYCFIGNTHTTLGDLDRALEAYQEYHRLEMELHESFPGNVDFKNNLGHLLLKARQCPYRPRHLDRGIGGLSGIASL
ncbi:MAG: tetratricopeptide repeat protein [Bacteroidia bacterium]